MSTFTCSSASTPSVANARLKFRTLHDQVTATAFFVGALKGEGVPSSWNTVTSHGWCRFNTCKLPAVTSAHVPNESVRPFYEAHKVRIYTILSGNICELCGRLVIFLRAVSVTGAGLCIGQQRCAGLRATVLSSGCSGHCWTNTSLSGRGAQPGVNR